jgi:hypothetical protein
LVDLVVEQLRTIKTSNSYTMYNQTGNYKTNIGDSVWIWRDVSFESDEPDSLIVRDLDEPLQLPSPYAERVERQLHIGIELIGRNAKSEKLRNEYLPDVEIAIGVGARTRWNNIGKTRPRKSISVTGQESVKIAGMIFEFYIDYPGYAFYPYPIGS